MEEYVREAISRLPGHWHQGGMGNGQGSHCGLGHISAVWAEKYEEGETSDYLMPDEIWAVMNEVAREQYPERIKEYDNDTFAPVDFAKFNDHPKTTESEVIAVMEKVAVRLGEYV